MKLTRIHNPYAQHASATQQKVRQAHSHDAAARTRAVPLEPVAAPAPQPFDCAAFVRADRIRRILAAFPSHLAGHRVFVSCAGTGDYGIRELLARGATVILSDLSEETMRAARERWRAFERIHYVVADAELLPCADAAVNAGYVHAGLHHLPRPTLGASELFRIAAEVAVVVEAHDSPLMRVLVARGLAEDWEESGNYVYRFSRREAYKLAASLGVGEVGVTTFANQYSAWLNTTVYPKLAHPWAYALFRVGYRLLNLLLGSQGNTFLLVLRR